MWYPKTDFEKLVVASQRGRDYIFGSLNNDSSLFNQSNDEEAACALKPDNNNDSKLKVIDMVQKIAGTKPLGELPSLSDWDTDEHLVQETIAMMRYAEQLEKDKLKFDAQPHKSKKQKLYREDANYNMLRTGRPPVVFAKPQPNGPPSAKSSFASFDNDNFFKMRSLKPENLKAYDNVNRKNSSAEEATGKSDEIGKVCHTPANSYIEKQPLTQAKKLIEDDEWKSYFDEDGERKQISLQMLLRMEAPRNANNLHFTRN